MRQGDVGETSPFDLLFDIVGTYSFSIAERVDQRQCTTSGLGHISREFKGHSYPNVVGREVQGYVNMFEGV